MTSIALPSQEQRPSLLTKLIKGHTGAATVAGILEIALFFPFDTVAKRLMSNRTRIQGDSFAGTMNNLNTAIFRSKVNASMGQKMLYLYPGSAYAVCYKVMQRVYKFAGQPYVRDYINTYHREGFSRTFGRHEKLMTESIAGCLIGIGEVMLLPLDRLKVLSQTNEAAMRNGVFYLLRCEGIRGMYAGTLVTITRNAPGSFCLFGGAAFTKDVVFHLDDYSRATTFQNLCASTVGACLSIAVTNPMDVIKTRVQNKDPGAKLSAFSALLQLLREEGSLALFKGLTPKIIASAPKLVFAYSMTEFLLQAMKGEQLTK